jgi:fructokinase
MVDAAHPTKPPFPVRGALIIGESLIDIVPSERSFLEIPGGSPMNVAVGLGRLGRPTVLATWVGRDAQGRSITDHVELAGVAVLPGSDKAVRTSTAKVTLDDAGQAQYVFDLSWVLPPIPEALEPPVVHLGSLAGTVEPGADAARAYLARNPHGATITYDPNIRPDVMGPAEPLRGRIEALVQLANVVKASEDDLAYLYPGRDAVDVARDWLALGPSLVVVTLGGEGAVALTADGDPVRVGVYPTQVADTVGAGDSFMGGMIDALWTLGLLGPDGKDALASITADQAAAVLDRASRISAITVSRVGANPPWASEL